MYVSASIMHPRRFCISVVVFSKRDKEIVSE